MATQMSLLETLPQRINGRRHAADCFCGCQHTIESGFAKLGELVEAYPPLVGGGVYRFPGVRLDVYYGTDDALTLRASKEPE